jgi:DNA repair exonuclease SbcCD nuclease subunit
LDNFWDTQWKKIRFILNLAKELEVPIIIGGDFFHHWKPSPYLLATTIGIIKTYAAAYYTILYTVYGQHDLPDHNFDLNYKSGLYTLEKADVVKILPIGNWGQSPEFGPGYKAPTIFHEPARPMTVWHKFVWDGKEIPWPGCDELTADQVLDKYPQYDLILTGDHHKPFVHEKDGRLLVNPGPITRQNADNDFKPRVYLWYDDDNKVEPVYLPIEEGVITREHIDKAKHRTEKLQSFVQRLDAKWEVSVSFLRNLKQYVSANKIRDHITSIIYKSIENEYGRRKTKV